LKTKSRPAKEKLRVLDSKSELNRNRIVGWRFNPLIFFLSGTWWTSNNFQRYPSKSGSFPMGYQQVSLAIPRLEYMGTISYPVRKIPGGNTASIFPSSSVPVPVQIRLDPGGMQRNRLRFLPDPSSFRLRKESIGGLLDYFSLRIRFTS
jgi:hypothetical protein